jgi:amino acid transporter
MTDYDATAHITEEINTPELKAPWAISSAMLFTYVAGFLFNIVLCFCMGNPDDILVSPMAQPVAQIFYNSLGKGGGMFFTIAGLIIIKFVTFTAMQALGRTVFAFSRDRMMPFSNVWIKIAPWTGTPLYAVWMSVLALTLLLRVFSRSVLLPWTGATASPFYASCSLESSSLGPGTWVPSAPS